MKKIIFLSSAVLMALLLVVVLTSGISKANQISNNYQASASQDRNPKEENSLQGEPVEWPSSKTVPENLSIISPQDHTGIDSLDADGATSSDSSMQLAGSVLRPRQSIVEWSASGSGGCIYASSGSVNYVFNTPVYLPQGAVVKYLRFYFYDTNDINSYAWFTVYDSYGGISREYHVTSTGNSGTGYATTSEFSETIDYDSYSYVINWRPMDLGNDMQACGFRIYYEAPPWSVLFAPLITNGSN